MFLFKKHSINQSKNMVSRLFVIKGFYDVVHISLNCLSVWDLFPCSFCVCNDCCFTALLSCASLCFTKLFVYSFIHFTQ